MAEPKEKRGWYWSEKGGGQKPGLWRAEKGVFKDIELYHERFPYLLQQKVQLGELSPEQADYLQKQAMELLNPREFLFWNVAPTIEDMQTLPYYNEVVAIWPEEWFEETNKRNAKIYEQQFTDANSDWSRRSAELRRQMEEDVLPAFKMGQQKIELEREAKRRGKREATEDIASSMRGGGGPTLSPALQEQTWNAAQADIAARFPGPRNWLQRYEAEKDLARYFHGLGGEVNPQSEANRYKAEMDSLKPVFQKYGQMISTGEIPTPPETQFEEMAHVAIEAYANASKNYTKNLQLAERGGGLPEGDVQEWEPNVMKPKTPTFLPGLVQGAKAGAPIEKTGMAPTPSMQQLRGLQPSEREQYAGWLGWSGRSSYEEQLERIQEMLPKTPRTPYYWQAKRQR